MKNLIFLETEIQMPLLTLPVRTTAVSLSNAQVLISPGSKLSDQQLSSVVGTTDIIAPNLLHSGGVLAASRVHPKAKLWVPDKTKIKNHYVTWDFELVEENWKYGNELALLKIEGVPKMSEVAFFHRESKSLIVSDLCFNLVEPKGLGAWLLLSIFGTYKKFGVSRLLMKMVEDKTAFKKSLNRLFEFDFENIVLSHGSNVMGGAKEKLRAAFRERGISFE